MLKVEHHFTFIKLWEDIESSHHCLTRATEAMYQPLALQTHAQEFYAHNTMSHLTTKPRLAMQRNDAGELVPSINAKTGEQDIQVAGTVASIGATEYVNEATGKTYFRGFAKIASKGKEVDVPVLFNGSTIEQVEKGSTYWLTVRPSEDGTITNFSCGGLRVAELVSIDVFNDILALANVAVEETETT